MRRSLTISLFPESRKRFLTAASLKFLSTQIAKSYLKIIIISLLLMKVEQGFIFQLRVTCSIDLHDTKSHVQF